MEERKYKDDGDIGRAEEEKAEYEASGAAEAESEAQEKIAKPKEKLVLFVQGRVTGKLTQNQLDYYQDEYLREAEQLATKIHNTRVSDMREVILEHMLPPFVYWLQNKLYCDKLNEEENGSKQEP